MADIDVVVYTRVGCHLCEEARETLLRHGLVPRMVDIDADEQLRAAYGTAVPVVYIDGKERFRGRVDETLLRRLLRNLRGQASGG
jgi:glutaredoxin